MYELVLGLHNIMRWVVLLAGLYALALAYRGLVGGGPWSRGDRQAGLIFSSALGLQFVLGLLLFVVSPLIAGAMRDMGAAMQADETRFFIAEHSVMMLLAVIAAQLGYSLSRRAEGDRAKFVRAAAGYTIAALLVVIAIPWWRPLLPVYWG